MVAALARAESPSERSGGLTRVGTIPPGQCCAASYQCRSAALVSTASLAYDLSEAVNQGLQIAETWLRDSIHGILSF